MADSETASATRAISASALAIWRSACSFCAFCRRATMSFCPCCSLRRLLLYASVCMASCCSLLARSVFICCSWMASWPATSRLPACRWPLIWLSRRWTFCRPLATCMQVASGRQNVQRLESQIKGHLQAGNREVAGQLAIQLQQMKTDLANNEQQLAMHTEAYNNNLLKLQQGQKDIVALRQKAQKLHADLQMAKAEAEIARVAEAVSESAIPNFSTKIVQAT